jgi:UDP-N-acetylglucosamine 2-epimerase (non-hydrolysing)
MTSTEQLRLLCVVGARPNFMKIAPIVRAFRARGAGLEPVLLHTGQHYDGAMKAAFFDQLGIPEPDVDLGVGSASHAVQTAEIMKRFEPQLERWRPDGVLVVGDVNSTIACSLVAAKMGVPVVHVEAGLRSYDRDMPEEINRVLTDQISALLFTTERGALDNLVREGIDPTRVHFVGNVMIDTLYANLPRAADPGDVLAQAAGGYLPDPVKGYGVVTLHRPSNVDSPRVLKALLGALAEIADRLPLAFPLHPRTLVRIETFGLQSLLTHPGILRLPPVGYLEMLGLLARARLVLSDSGGIQEETTALGVPCATLRENTERPITVEQGTNTLVGTDPAAIRACVDDILDRGGKRGRVPERWDGHAAERIAAIIARELGPGVGGSADA